MNAYDERKHTPRKWGSDDTIQSMSLPVWSEAEASEAHHRQDPG